MHCPQRAQLRQMVTLRRRVLSPLASALVLPGSGVAGRQVNGDDSASPNLGVLPGLASGEGVALTVGLAMGLCPEAYAWAMYRGENFISCVAQWGHLEPILQRPVRCHSRQALGLISRT